MFTTNLQGHIETNQQIEFKEIVKQLNDLANLVIEDTVERLIKYFTDEEEDLFYDKVNKAKNYKNAYILKLFLKRLQSKIPLEKLTPLQKKFINYVKEKI